MPPALLPLPRCCLPQTLDGARGPHMPPPAEPAPPARRCPAGAVAPAAAGVAGQAADDDVEEGDDAADYGHDNAANAVDDSHDGPADSAEARFNLRERVRVSTELTGTEEPKEVDVRKKRRRPL